MALSPKMLELQRAMDFYGDTTLRNFTTAHKFGDEITYTMTEYLGEGAQVIGVNPEGAGLTIRAITGMQNSAHSTQDTFA